MPYASNFMKISVIGGGPGGLYFALLIKKAFPSYSVAVYERNRADDTFGFGVVFSDETLGIFREYDLESYEMIRRHFAYWGDVDIHVKGHRLRCGGNGFCGCSRQTLLGLLQTRCREVGVALHFSHEIDRLEMLADSDLIVAADGIHSRIREQHREAFGTEITLHQNKFCWLGSTKSLDAFKFFFREIPQGIVIAHAYQYEPHKSTWVIETSEKTWRARGWNEMSEAEYMADIATIFADELEGHPLIANRSIWRNFPTIRNRHWVKDNIALLGDAKSTAHFSIGSGTKLAMEDAIALFEALRHHRDLPSALATYETERREEVEKTQYAAEVSLAWFENVARYWHLPPEQFAFGVMSRSKQITYEQLQLRDAAFVQSIEQWFLGEIRAQGYKIRNGTPPMFTPFRLREMEVVNRVVVSPMAQYSAVDGVPNEWHFVHYSSRAMGGAGLLFIEMTCTSSDARISPGCTGLWNESQMLAFKRIVEFVHANSPTKIVMQLGHAGRKGSTQRGWEESDYPLPSLEENWELYSASPLPYYEGISQTPQELSRADMERIIADFVRSTDYAKQAGFDMLEIHMAHGYLLASFISPLTNQRTDDYGGSIDNRMRFPLEVFRAVRAVWEAEKPMSVRISATDWHPDGLTGEELVRVAELLKEAGADLVDVSAGQTVPDQQPVYGRMFQTPFADKIRNEVDIATMSVGNITTPDQVNTILLQGRADLVALARPHLMDPYFTLHAAAHYDYRGQYFPNQYLTGRNQLYRLQEREREQQKEMRLKLKPPSHEVREP
jgi:anthraniloyl-CoA monooxygenase